MRLSRSLFVVIALLVLPAARSVLAAKPLRPPPPDKTLTLEVLSPHPAGLVPSADFSPEEDDLGLLRSAGLSTEDAGLLAFLRTRMRLDADPGRLKTLLGELGSAVPAVQHKAAADLLACGSPAVPALRRLSHDLDNPELARRARECLRWIEPPTGIDLTCAAVRLLAQRRTTGGTEVLLAYLPCAENEAVTAALEKALANLAFTSGKPDPALLRALTDPLALRRAVAAEVLCRSDEPGVGAEIRRLLLDPNPAVRLRTGLALIRQPDKEAIPALIDLLGELPQQEAAKIDALFKELAGEWAPGLPLKSDTPLGRRIRHDVWAAWWRTTNDPALLAEFRNRTLNAANEERLRGLIHQLGNDAFTVREQAVGDLMALGPFVLPLLRNFLQDPDPEIRRRVENCVQRIEKDSAGHQLPVAAPRLVALLKPPGGAEVLLDYLPYAESETMTAEVQTALAAMALRQGQPEPALLRGLTDRLPLRRAAAAQALCRGGVTAAFPEVSRLLKDPDPTVRLRTALGLVVARQKEAVPVLIELARDLPAEQAAEAEELLTEIGGEQGPSLPVGDAVAVRRQRYATWTAWWRQHGATADLSRLSAESPQLGYTLLCLVENSGNGKVVELGRDGKPRWEIDNLQYPVDAHILPGNRVLIAEYTGRKVTERQLQGDGSLGEQGPQQHGRQRAATSQR